MEFAWTVHPMPKAATEVSAAKMTPSHFAFIPRSRTYIGPPHIAPLASFTRKRTERSASEYFVAMPKTPVSHIQRTAPGPPAATAVATPTMFPVPIVAARAVVSAPNWLTSPAPSFSRLKEILMAVQRCRWGKPRRNVRKRCVPKSRMMRGQPQMKSLPLARSCSMAAMPSSSRRKKRGRSLPESRPAG